ncbi:MAG: helix-turn-helix domain-containing protein [Rhodobacteraceae bacterium]|nr:helix-turn-helix domain-containing protein [Paracoccaceae bacterium]
MPRSDRLLRLLQHLLTEPAPVTAARLASLSGVSERAIYPDIAALRAAGAIVDAQAGSGQERAGLIRRSGRTGCRASPPNPAFALIRPPESKRHTAQNAQ